MNGTELILRKKYAPHTLQDKAAPAAALVQEVVTVSDVAPATCLTLSNNKAGTAEHVYPYPAGSSFNSLESLLQFATNSAIARGDSEEVLLEHLARMVPQFHKANH